MTSPSDAHIIITHAHLPLRIMAQHDCDAEHTAWLISVQCREHPEMGAELGAALADFAAEMRRSPILNFWSAEMWIEEPAFGGGLRYKLIPYYRSDLARMLVPDVGGLRRVIIVRLIEALRALRRSIFEPAR